MKPRIEGGPNLNPVNTNRLPQPTKDPVKPTETGVTVEQGAALGIAGIALTGCTSHPVEAKADPTSSAGTSTKEPTQTPVDTQSPQGAPTPSLPVSSPTPEPSPTREPTKSVMTVKYIDYSQTEQFAKDGLTGYRYQYDPGQLSLTPLDNVPLEDVNQAAWLETAKTNSTLVSQRAGGNPDKTILYTNGKKKEDSRNAAISYKGNSIMWPSFQVGADRFLSASPSEWWFGVPTDAKKVSYTEVKLPDGYTSDDVHVGWIGDNQFVKLTAKDGKAAQVFNPIKNEWKVVENKPSQEVIKTAVDPFVKAMNREGAKLIQEQVINSLQSASYTGKDGKKYEILGTPDGYSLLIREENGVWERLTKRKVASTLGILIGGSFSDPYFKSSFGRDAVDQAMAKEFNSAYLLRTSWPQTEKKEGVFDLTPVEEAIKKAKSNNMKVHGDHLVYPFSNFKYTYLKDMKNLDKETLMKLMVEHIRGVVTPLKGKVDVWNVVNESRVPSETTPDGSAPYDLFNKIIGEEYIEIAFQTVRSIDPEAKLIYNETRNERPKGSGANGRLTERTKEIVNRLKSKGLIDGVGVQFHLDANNLPNPEDVKRTIQSYGIPVYITEFDIDFHGSRTPEKEAKIYQDYIRTLISSGVVVEINFWNANTQLQTDELEPNRTSYEVIRVLIETQTKH